MRARENLSMYDFELTHETPAKVEDVWAVYAEVQGWPRWNEILESVSFGGPFESGAAGSAVVSVALSTSIQFRLENVEPMTHFDVVWNVGHLLTTRMTHRMERTAAGTKITSAYHTGGIMAPFNFLQASAARDRVGPAMERVAQLAEARSRGAS
jgi:Polyketide cyclase / dehydrase and lipid transport